ncbi:hypothetical protein P154DRAFT_609621 [Amniculicola lignicola CBS 123094]|uniref:Uncharacterized protein n=1 Tax=Amniculicola lignicola CBS 123094 TaxID=1392246 RepID=A0A6A5W9Z3_9PLEO|nr:hypothetical protein P154DRAFT_609621 [Amniculicola lignicola CBS 123094]
MEGMFAARRVVNFPLLLLLSRRLSKKKDCTSGFYLVLLFPSQSHTTRRGAMRFCALPVVIAGFALVATVIATHPDFKQCYNSIQNFTTDGNKDNLLCNNKAGLSRQDDSFRQHVTLEGCLALCGDGYQLWPKTETGLRFLYFILPLFILAARYASAPIGVGDKLWTFAHLVGDPIDSLWSTLLRLEKARRNHHYAMAIAPGAPRDVAAVWTAYDLWWDDPTSYTRDGLQKRYANRNSGDARSDQGAQDAAQNQQLGPKPLDLLTLREICFIKKCALSLAKNRSHRPLWSWVAIIIFLISLTGAYIRTATTEKNNQTSHTLAVVMLFSFLIIAVYISGQVGNFTRLTDVVTELEGLHQNCKDLFPSIQANFVPRTQSGLRSFEQHLEEAAIYSGVNHSWRPGKRLQGLNHGDRKVWILLAIAFIAVTSSCAVACSLSYLTPRVGVGCRSLTWASIYLTWVVSVVPDLVLWCMWPRMNAKSARMAWKWLIPKDLFITSSIITIVIVVQLGFFNNCRCLASNLLGASDPTAVCIDLGPVTSQQLKEQWFKWLAFPISGLVLILLIIFFIAYEGEGGKQLLFRTESELRSEEQALATMETRLNMKPQIPPDVASINEEDLSAPDGQNFPVRIPLNDIGQGSQVDDYEERDSIRSRMRVASVFSSTDQISAPDRTDGSHEPLLSS